MPGACSWDTNTWTVEAMGASVMTCTKVENSYGTPGTSMGSRMLRVWMAYSDGSQVSASVALTMDSLAVFCTVAQ